MYYFDSTYEAGAGVDAAYLAERSNLPAHMQTLLDPYTGTNLENVSRVDLICHFVHSAYANKGNSAVEPLFEVAAAAGAKIAEHGFWGSLDGKVSGMILAFRRDSGEEAEPEAPWPDPENDPAPDSTYLPPA